MLSQEDREYGFTDVDIEEFVESFLHDLTGESVRDVWEQVGRWSEVWIEDCFKVDTTFKVDPNTKTKGKHVQPFYHTSRY